MNSIYDKFKNHAAVFFAVILFVSIVGCAGETLIYTQIAVENVVYKLNDENETASAIRYNNEDGTASKELLIQDVVKANKMTYRVTSIGTKAFIDSDFTSISLGINLQAIEKEAFKYSKAIEEISFCGKVLPALAEDAFDQAVYESATLIVPEGAEIPFPWTNFKNVKRSTVIYL